MTSLAILDFRESPPANAARQSVHTPFGAVAYDDTASDLIVLAAAAADPRANAYAARWLGAERVIAVLTEPSVSQPVLPVDFIEFTSGRPTTFFEVVGTGYVQQQPPFCAELSAALHGADAALHGAGAALHGAGAAQNGLLLILDELPQPAARQWWRSRGVDYFTTQSQPDGALCRELEMCWAVLLTPPGFDLLPWLPGARLPAVRSCPCPQTMQFARQSGRLPADWRGWIAS